MSGINSAMDSSAQDPINKVLKLQWMECSGSLFNQLKHTLQIGNNWLINLSSPDIEWRELADPRGTAALMLRKIQAMRAILQQDDPSDSFKLITGYASDLSRYLDSMEVHPPSEATPKFLETAKRCKLLTRQILTAAALCETHGLNSSS